MERQKEVEWVGRISDEFCGGKRALSKDIACKCFHSFNLKINLKIFFTKIDSSKCDPKDSFLSIAPSQFLPCANISYGLKGQIHQWIHQ